MANILLFAMVNHANADRESPCESHSSRAGISHPKYQLSTFPSGPIRARSLATPVSRCLSACKKRGILRGALKCTVQVGHDDYRSGVFGGVFPEACADLYRVAVAAKPDAITLVDTVFNAAITKYYNRTRSLPGLAARYDRIG